MAGIWDAYNPSAAAPSEDKPWYSDAYEVGRQAVAGAAVDLPRMAGQAARWVAADGTDVDEWGRSTVEAADARAPGWEPDMQGRGGLAATLIKGSRAVGPMVPAIAASFVPGGQWIAPAVAAGQFGASSAQDTEDKLRNQGIPDAEATAAGWRTGLIQGPMEGLATAAGGWALRGAKPLLGIGAQTTGSVAARMTDTAVLKPLAKGLGLNLLAQPATEVIQDVGTEFNERSYGAAPEDAWAIAKDSAQGAVGLTLLLGPFAAGGQVRRAQRADQIKQALYNPSTPEAVRAQTRDMVVQAAATEGVGPQDADAWLDEQFQADDARFAADQAREDAMIARTAQGQYEDSVRQRAAQNKQDRVDIRALMREQTAPLGEITPSVTADTQGAAAITQTLESSQRAQMEREQAAAQAAVPPSPEQIEEQRAAEAQVLLAQEAVAFIQQNQIAAKNALPVVKEMLSSPDVMTPALRGAMRGALVTGDVNGARKMLAEAKKAQLKAIADAEKAAAAIEKDQKEQDEFAAKVVAAGDSRRMKKEQSDAPAAPQGPAAAANPAAVPGATPSPTVEAAGLTTQTQGATANVPQPAQPGTQTSQAESPQGAPTGAAQPVAEKTPGQKLVEKLEERSGKKVNAKVRRRLYLLAGLDPVDGLMVSSPRTMDQVAAIEAVLDGKAKPVSRAAIAKSLKAVGVGGETMDRLADNSSSEVTDAAQEQDEDGTLKERVAPEDNTPALSDDAFGAVMDGDNENPGAMKVRSNLGSGIVEPAMTAAQKRAELEANKLLGGTRFEGARARNEAAVAEATAPAITAEQAAENRRVIAENAKLFDELNAEIDKSVSLNNLLDHPALIAEVDRAKDEWSEIGVPADGDLAWADMPAAQQAEWVRAFARWDNGVDSDSVYYRNFSEINDAARKTVASRAQGKDTTRVGAGNQNNGERQGSGQEPVAAGAGSNEGRAPAAVGADNQGDGGQPEGVQLDTGGARFSRAWTLGGQLDRAGQPVTVIGTDLVDLENSPGVKRAFDKYRKDGIGHIIDAVEQWGFTRQLVDWSGAYLRVDGKPMMILPQRTLMQGEMSEWTVHHEMGHAIDLTPAGARYSSHPAMSMRIVGNSIRAHGEVMEQVIDYYEANPDSLFSETMAYPLDRTKNGDLDADAVRQEVFAQLWATFNTPVGKDLLYDQLPDVAYFMETVYEDIAQIDFRSENSSAAADGPAAQGAVREARQTSSREGGQDSQQGAGVDGQRVSGQAGVTDTAGKTPAPLDQFLEAIGDFVPNLADYLSKKSIREIFDSRVRQLVALELGDASALTSEVISTAGKVEFRQVHANNRPYPETVPAKVSEQALMTINALWIKAESEGWSAETGGDYRTNPVLNRLGAEFGLDFERMVEFDPQAPRFIAGMRDDSTAFVQLADAIAAAQAKHLISATSSAFNRWGNSMHFSRGTALPRSPKPGTVLRTIAQLPKPAQSPVRNAVATLGDWANKGLDRVVFTADLIDRAVRQGMKSAKVLEEVLTKRANTVRELEYEVSRIADMYALVPESDRGDGPHSLNRFLFDSTRTGKWGYGKDADPEMAARFEALKPESKALVEAVFDHGARMLADKKRMVLEFTASEYDAEIAYAKANPDQVTAKELAELHSSKKADLAKFKTLFALREGIPYAPIKRIGTYAVVAKSPEYRDAEEAGDTAALRKLEQDADHYHVSFVESKNEGRDLRDRLMQDGFFGSDPNAIDLIERDKFSDDLYGGQTMLGALTKLRAKVDAGVAAGDKSSAKLRTMVSELYLQALAEGSARKSEMRRRGIAGEVDMLRSFANQGRADATFMASVVANPQAQDAVMKMRQESRRGGDTTRKSELFNEIMARYLGTMEVDHSPILNKLTRATSIWFLATSPGYYLQNLTQPWMMSVPAMGGRFGWGKSSAALWKAYSELNPVMQGTKLFEQSFDFTRVPEDTREAIVELAKRGRIDIGMETEMGEFRVEGVGPVTDRWNKIDKGMRLLVQKGESVNRLSTGIAAYRLFMQNQPNAQHADAVNYAEQVLSDTHGNYDRFSAPRAFNSKLGKVMLQFRKFQLVQLTFYAKLIRDAYQGNDRKVALRTLAYSLLHTGTMAGVMGMPGYAAVAWLMGMLGSDDDEKFDLTYELRKLIGDEHLATMLLRGVPTIAGADLSGKIGAGNMLSLMPFSNADITTPSGVAETAGTALGGASLGLAARMLDGMGLMLKGDWYKGIERTMPKGISDAMAAYRMASEGMTRRNGDVLLPSEDISEVDTLIKALGFATADQSVVYERRDRAFKNDEHLRDRSTRIKNDYIKAVKGNDNQGRNEAIAAWSKLQARRNAGGYRVQPMSELIKAPMEQAKRERGTVGGVQTTRNNQGYVRDMTAQ